MALPPTYIHRFLGGSPERIHGRLVAAGLWSQERTLEELRAACAEFNEAERRWDEQWKDVPPPDGPSSMDRFAQHLSGFLNEAGHELARSLPRDGTGHLSAAAQRALALPEPPEEPPVRPWYLRWLPR